MLRPGHSHRFPAYAWRDLDCPHRPTLVFPAHFVLTRVHPGTTSRSATHPQIAPSQARSTFEFFGSGLPEKKVHLVDMSSLSFLLSQDVTHTHSKEPTSSLASGTFPLGTRVCVQCRHMDHPCSRTDPHTPV